MYLFFFLIDFFLFVFRQDGTCLNAGMSMNSNFDMSMEDNLQFETESRASVVREQVRNAGIPDDCFLTVLPKNHTIRRMEQVVNFLHLHAFKKNPFSHFFLLQQESPSESANLESELKQNILQSLGIPIDAILPNLNMTNRNIKKPDEGNDEGIFHFFCFSRE